MRAAAVAALLLAAFSSSAAAATRLVDDDKAECPNAGFTTIQAAAIAAGPGDTVAICPGTYNEAGILIDKPLTLKGAGADLVRIQAPSGAQLFDYIVRATGPGPVDISGVTIAAGNPPAQGIRAVDGGVVFDDVDGSVSASRFTDLATDATPGVGIGVSAQAGTGAVKTVTVAGSLLEGYGATGIVASGSGPGLNINVADSILRGRGPIATPGRMQDGVEVLGTGVTTTVTGNLITDHRNTSNEVDGAAVRLFNGNSAGEVTGNDLQGNGYGVFLGDASGECDVFPAPSTPLNAQDNWWGNPSGPTPAPRPSPVCLTPLTSSSPADRVNGGVDTANPAAEPHGAPVVPAAQADGPPLLTITSPADGAEAEPGTPVTVSASAEDDFDVKRVEFRRGATLVATRTAPPYSAPVNAPAAGTSQVVTATAIDSSGQSAVAAISMRGTVPPEQPSTPQAPAESEDRPPTVAITGPAPGAQIDPGAAPRITAEAADDRGVARVVFFDDGQQVCSDDTAPYDCAYVPNGGDVGRNTLIAIAVDGAGQGAVDFRGVEVRRFNPKLTARTTPKRDRRRPYRYTTTGSVLLPAGVTPAQACSGGGSVAIEFRAGKLRLPMTATLRSDCSFRTSIAFPSRRSLGSGRIAITAKFGGNTVLGTAKAASQKVRAG